MSTVLVVEPEQAHRIWLVEALEASGHAVEALADPDVAMDRVRVGVADVVLTRMGTETSSQTEFLRQIRAASGHTALVVMIPAGNTETIVEAVRQGADHCLILPLDREALRIVISRASEKPLLAREAQRDRVLANEVYDAGRFEQIVGSHPSMQRLAQKTLQAARSMATVLIHGETGTGKELLAAALHQSSRRADGPYIRLNCSSLSDSLLESELFGHERGAFTGAASRRLGRFERAHGGTLFLDEVSEIPKSIQVKLLRFLQERELERVGGDETVRVDVRVVAATNRDLKPMVTDGSFREDLYYRLHVVRLEVPPLRARPSDIPLLADHFLRKFAEREEREIVGFSGQASEALLAHPWPGNVRELQNIVEQAVVLSDGRQIEVDDLPFEAGAVVQDPLRLMIPGVSLAELERFAILKTLEAVSGSPSRAAKILGVSRRTIQYRLQEWGVAKRHAPEPAAGSVEGDSPNELEESPE